MLEQNLIEKEGFEYKFNPLACFECGGACCIGESGYIWVKYHEIKNIANFLNMTIEEFSNKYLKRVNRRYSLREIKIDKNNYACIFFNTDSKGCNIYEVRPTQCQKYPFWEIFKNNKEEVKKECLGVI
jgi:Fe-S-cluster containining protein